jgi:dihydrofolate reductase
VARLIVSEFVSVDGVMEAPGGEKGYAHSGWVFQFGMDPDQMAYKLDEVRSAEALLLGRVTYEGFAAAWPGRDDEAGFAAKMNSMPKYVVSRRQSVLTWENSTLLLGDPAESVAALKASLAGPILVAGSRTLVHTLHRHELVDEYRLMVFPIVLGSGRRLFPDDAPGPARLRLVDSTTFGSGVAVHTYVPAKG